LKFAFPDLSKVYNSKKTVEKLKQMCSLPNRFLITILLPLTELMTKFPDHWSTTSITPNMAQPYNTILTSEIVSKLLEKQFPVKLFCRLHRSADEDDPEEVLWKKANLLLHS
jgi:hypothetical protein